MQLKFALASLAIATQVYGIPHERRAVDVPADHPTLGDTLTLNAALAFEHIENAFYQSGLEMFTQDDFDKAGFAGSVRAVYEQIAVHEESYVKNLTTMLGDKAVKPCTYQFNTNLLDVSEFISTTTVLETIGSSGYNGAARSIGNHDLVQLLTSILATKARTSSMINSIIFGLRPRTSAYETPLDLIQTFTLVAGSIVECPPDENAIPVQAFPDLSVDSLGVTRGSNVSFEFTLPDSAGDAPLFATFLNGITPIPLPLSGPQPFTVMVPTTLEPGVIFLVITNSSDTSDDSVTVAGPVALTLV